MASDSGIPQSGESVCSQVCIDYLNCGDEQQWRGLGAASHGQATAKSAIKDHAISISGDHMSLCHGLFLCMSLYSFLSKAHDTFDVQIQELK